GPQKAVTALASISSSTFIGGTADGRVVSYSCENGNTEVVPGAGHSTIITDLASNSKDRLVYSVGYDDRVREIQVDAAAAASYT
ncbi:hypothetical protein C0991_008140, partial [Blastosporella zonata]